MRILLFHVDCLKCATHSSWIFDTFVCFSEPFFTDKGTGYKHCMCQVLMVDINFFYLSGRMSKRLGAQKFFAE